MKTQSRLVITFITLAIIASIWPHASLEVAKPLRLPALSSPVSLLPQTPALPPPIPPAVPSAPLVTPPVKPTPKPPATKVSADSHPNYQYTALITNSTPLYPMEPFNGRISAPAALNAVSASNINSPIVAVIDTGFALNHDDLKTRWATNSSEMGTTVLGSVQSCTSQGMALDKRCNNYDNDNDGYPSDWRGWDFVHNDNNPMAGKTNPTSGSVSHGSLTASLAAVINPNARIMPLQALDDTGVGYTDTVAAAVRYAADHGASVISLSLGSSYDDAFLRAAIDYAIDKGAVVVAAAGNSGCNCLSYPAAYPEVLSVGASDSTDNLASFSSYGANLDVVAPGTAGDVCGAVWSSGNQTSNYSCSYSGTSFATPLVASVASLLQTQEPSATTSDIIRFITQNADKVAGMNGNSRTLQYGYGRINVYKSILAASLATPQGHLISKVTASLTASDLVGGPLLDSTCQASPGATCDIRLTSQDNSTIKYLGAQVLDQYGGANFIWNAASVGLTPGVWKVEAVLTDQGQTTVKPAAYLTISP